LCLFTEYNPSKLYVDVPTFRSVMEGLAEECKKIEEDLAMADTAVEQLVKVDEIIKEVERELPLLDEKISSTEVLEEMAEVVDDMVKPEAWAQVQLKGDNSSLLKGKELIDTNVSGLLEAFLPNYLVHRSALFEVIQPMMSCIGFHSEFRNDPVLIWDKWYYPTVHYSGSKESAQSYLGAVELRLAGERADHDPDILSRWNFALWWEAVTESGNLCLENDLGDEAKNIASLNRLDHHLGIYLDDRMPVLPKRMILRLYMPVTSDGMMHVAHRLMKLSHWFKVSRVRSRSYFDTSLWFQLDRRERANEEAFTLWRIKNMQGDRAQEIWERLSWRLEPELNDRTKKLEKLFILYLMKMCGTQAKILSRLVRSYVNTMRSYERAPSSEVRRKFPP